jgi:hypothetical protein
MCQKYHRAILLMTRIGIGEVFLNYVLIVMPVPFRIIFKAHIIISRSIRNDMYSIFIFKPNRHILNSISCLKRFTLIVREGDAGLRYCTPTSSRA